MKAESDSSRPRVLFPRPGCVRKYGCIYPPGFIFPMALRHSAASLTATAPRPGSPPQRSGQFLRYSAPASNKPHPAEKSTPVWLAIWRTWAGFANSQLLPDAAALSSMQGLPRSGNSSAQTSASLHPPAALRLRCLPFTGHGRPRSVRKSSRLRVKMPVHLIAAAQTDANLSAHLHRLPTPPPYLRRMRLSPGRVRRYWVPEVVISNFESPNFRKVNSPF